MAKGRGSRARRGGARGEPRPQAWRDSRGSWHDKFGRFAASRAAARESSKHAPAPPPRTSAGTFGKPGAKVELIQGRDAAGRFTGPLPLSDPLYRLRDQRALTNVSRVPGKQRWKVSEGVRDFIVPLDRTTNRHRAVVAVVEGYFEQDSPDSFGGTEEEPVVRHFYVGTFTGLQVLELTEEQVMERVDELMAQKLWVSLRLLAVLERVSAESRVDEG